MIISCNKCRTTFDIDDRHVKPEGTKVRCFKCQNIFHVYPPEKDAPSFEEEAVLQDEPPEQEEALAEEASDAPAHSFTIDPARQTETDVEPPPFAESPEKTAELKASKRKKASSKKARPKGKRYISFRRRLMYFAILLIGFIAVVVIPIEIYRPIQELYHMIDNAKTFIAGLNSAIDTKELDRMNHFALNIIEEGALEADNRRDYYFLSFNMLITEGKILPKEEVMEGIGDFEAFGGKDKFNYEWLKDTGRYWHSKFLFDKEIQGIFKKYKELLVKSAENAGKAGFSLSNISLLLDTGKKEGFFENQMAFILDSLDWFESSYSGEPCEVAPEEEDWRAGALTGRGGYGHNKVSDPNNWFLPKFDTDEWGTWFSVWLTVETVSNYNVINIDFEASRVKKALMVVLVTVALMIFFLLTISLLIANYFSKSVTRPITELTRGAQEVSSGNYDYMVPVLHEDEIGNFTKQFNLMTQGQKERLNLMETMEKFLSKELAEKAAESGLMFGGTKTNCTVMFTDFAGFSTITRKMTAAEAVSALNEYFDGLIPIIKKYGGFPDKYIGDAIVAIFGAPVVLEDHAVRAVACAIEMQWKIKEINRKRTRENLPVFEMRIGLNSGEVLVGAIGCDQKLEYTSIGETTNLANRMESICDIGHVMIAEGTYEHVKNVFFKGVHIKATPDQVEVKGYPKPVAAFRIYVDNREITKDIKTLDPLYNLYTYIEVDHHLKYSPREVPNINFTSKAKFL